MRELTVISFTEKGTELNQKICSIFKNTERKCTGYTVNKYATDSVHALPMKAKEFTGKIWNKSDIIYIGAAGIAVRCIAPWVKDKFTDPAVLVLDEKGRYVIPILSSHVGGAAQLADILSEKLCAQSVHTTATDVQEKFAVDVFAVKNHLLITDRDAAKHISAGILSGMKAALYADERECVVPENIPDDLILCKDKSEMYKYYLKIYISDNRNEKIYNNNGITLVLRPVNVTAGLGCRKGISLENLETGLNQVLEKHGLAIEQLEALVSIDLKKNEPAILKAAEKYGLPFLTFTADELNKIRCVSSGSDFVFKVTGTDNVCERAALTFCKGGTLIQKKCIMKCMTIALARRKILLEF